MTSQIGDILKLGDDMWVEIWKFLDLGDVGRCARTNKSIASIYKRNEIPILKNIYHLQVKTEVNSIGIASQRLSSIVETVTSGFKKNSEFTPFILKEIIFKFPQSHSRIGSDSGVSQKAVFVPKYPVLNPSRSSKLTESELETYLLVTDKIPYVFVSHMNSNAFRLQNGSKILKWYTGHDSRVLDILPISLNPFSTQVSSLQKHVTTTSLFNHRVASGCARGEIKIWGMGTAKVLSTLNGHESAVYSIQTVQSKLVSGSADTTLKLWDMESEKEIDTCRKHTNVVYNCHSDGVRSVISTSKDGTIHLFDVNNNNFEWITEIETGDKNEGPVYHSSQSGYYLATIHKGDVWRLFDLRKSTKKPITTKSNMQCTSMTMNDYSVVVGHGRTGSTISIYDIATMEWQVTRNYESLHTMAICKDGIYY
jgi:WD40 repeat protein